MSLAEISMLRWMCSKIRKDKFRNEDIHRQVRIMLIEDQLKENCLQWFGHVGLRLNDAHIRRIENINIAQDKKLRRRPKMMCMEVIKSYMKLLEL